MLELYQQYASAVEYATFAHVNKKENMDKVWKLITSGLFALSIGAVEKALCILKELGNICVIEKTLKPIETVQDLEIYVQSIEIDAVEDLNIFST